MEMMIGREEVNKRKKWSQDEIILRSEEMGAEMKMRRED